MGERFYLYLRYKGLTQKQVSELSGIVESVISRFCHGGIITSDKLQRLLDVCDDLSLEWLFYNSGEMIRKCDGNITYNMGAFAGADVVTDGSTQVKNCPGAKVGARQIKDYVAALDEKDRIISEKDAIISERDRTIGELQKRLLELSK